MNREEKTTKTLSGTLLCPLMVGEKAVIFHQGLITRTSRVVAVHSRTADEIRFETLNTEYRLLTGPDREQAAGCFPMALAA